MTFWKTTLNLSINNTKLKTRPIQIKRGIYQGDSLSPFRVRFLGYITGKVVYN
jgi:hypothetical protein